MARGNKLTTENIGKQEVEISSQITISDKNWDILKKYRVTNEDLSFKYTYLLKCKNCGYEKEMSGSSIYKNHIKCPICVQDKEIGQVYNGLEVLKFEKKSPSGEKMYSTKCTRCGHIFDARRINDIKNTKDKGACKYCNFVGENDGINHFYQNYIIGAKNRGLSFDLTPSQFLDYISQDCEYCGSSPELHEYKVNGKLKYTNYINGIDRIDSSKGYSVDNCVPCCSKCNKMKLDYSVEDFKNHIDKIYNHFVKGSETIENTSNDGSE